MTRSSHATIAIASLVSERDWQGQVTQAAEMFRWTWAHFRPAMIVMDVLRARSWTDEQAHG